MALKSVLDNLDDVQEPLKPFYTQVDDKFVLQVEDADSLPDVANLKNAYTAEKQKRQTQGQELATLKTKLEDYPEDFDPKVWEAAKSGKPDDAALVELRRTLEGERDTAISERDDARKQVRSLKVDLKLDEALSDNGITSPAFQKAARALLSPQVSLDDKGNPVVDSDMGPLALADHVKRWAAGDGKDFVSPPKGGDAKGNDKGTGKGGSGDLADKVPGFADLPEK